MKQLLKYDITLQWRQGFWLVYFIVSLVFLVILFSIPQHYRLPATIYILLSDTSVLGATFIGALILLEKQQNVLQSLFVTPLSLRHYLISKALSLTCLIFCMSLVIYLPVNAPGWHYVPVLFTTIVSSVIFTFLGMGVSARVRTVNQYLGGVIGLSMIIVIPVIPFIIFDYTEYLIVFPLNAALDMMISVIESSWTFINVIESIILVVWAFIGYCFAYQQFNRHVLNA